MPVTARNFERLDKDNGQTGITAPSARGWDELSVLIGSNTTHGARFVPSRNMTITKVGFVISVASGSASDAVDVGIADSTGAIVASSGSTTGQLTPAGVKAISLTTPYTVLAGVTYYAVVSYGSVTTAPEVMIADFANGFVVERYGTTIGKREGLSVTSAGPPLATLASANRNSQPTCLTVRES